MLVYKISVFKKQITLILIPKYWLFIYIFIMNTSHDSQDLSNILITSILATGYSDVNKIESRLSWGFQFEAVLFSPGVLIRNTDVWALVLKIWDRD